MVFGNIHGGRKPASDSKERGRGKGENRKKAGDIERIIICWKG